MNMSAYVLPLGYINALKALGENHYFEGPYTRPLPFREKSQQQRSIMSGNKSPGGFSHSEDEISEVPPPGRAKKYLRSNSLKNVTTKNDEPRATTSKRKPSASATSTPPKKLRIESDQEDNDAPEDGDLEQDDKGEDDELSTLSDGSSNSKAMDELKCLLKNVYGCKDFLDSVGSKGKGKKTPTPPKTTTGTSSTGGKVTKKSSFMVDGRSYAPGAELPYKAGVYQYYGEFTINHVCINNKWKVKLSKIGVDWGIVLDHEGYRCLKNALKPFEEQSGLLPLPE